MKCFESNDSRNEYIHGKSKAENIEKKKEICRKRIQQLYKMPRTELTLEGKKIFRQPVRFRLKLGYSAMRQWIEMAEFTFQRRMTMNEKRKISWYYPIQKRDEKKTNSKQGHFGKKNDKQKEQTNKKQTKLNQFYNENKIPSQRPWGG